MHANETRAPHVFRIGEGGADSHEVLNSSEPVMLLSEAQLEACWTGIADNREAAISVAARFVSEEMAEDVVHTVALRFVENAQQSTNPEPFPADEDEFLRKFLTAVRNHAYDCVRDSKRPACPVHSHWGIDLEPELRGHNLADRALDTLFARNDYGKYDAPMAAARRKQDSVVQLHQILKLHLYGLSKAQREILVESFFDEAKRADIAARRGITESTYDNHRQAAFKALRESLTADVEAAIGVDRSIWYDLIEELIERRAARLDGRSSSKKGKGDNSAGKRGNSEGKRGNSEDEARNSRGERRNVEGKRRNVGGERRAVRGERSNSAHKPGNNAREATADEPFAVTSPGARNESKLAGRSS